MKEEKDKKRIWAMGDDEFDEEEYEEDDFEEDEEDEEEEYYISYACEDCDYRWEVLVEDDEEIDAVQYCPMCGSANTTQI